MVGSNREIRPTISNLEFTYIDLEPVGDQSLAKDIIEIVTGISTNAAAAGSKITAGSIIYADGQASSDQQTANNIFWIGSLIASSLDFIMIPLGYLYKLYKKEPIPFNFENNFKWVLTGVTLLLAIISAAAAVTSRVVSFIGAGLAIVVGIVSVCKYFYDYKKTGRQYQTAVRKVETLTEEIQMDMEMINHLQDQIRLMNVNRDNQTLLNNLVIQLAAAYRSHHLHTEELKTSYQQLHNLERQFIRQKSPVELIANCVKFGLAGLVLLGTLLTLNPITAGMGMIMLATAALGSLLTIIAKKTIQIIQKRIERDHERKRCLHIEISLTSTSTLFKAFQAAPSSPHLTDSPVLPPSSPLDATEAKPVTTTFPNKNDNNETITPACSKPYFS